MSRVLAPITPAPDFTLRVTADQTLSRSGLKINLLSPFFILLIKAWFVVIKWHC